MLLPRRALPLSVTGAILVLLAACGSSKPELRTFPIGQKVQAGKLSYQVIDAQWAGEVPGAKTPPKNRILQLQILVTNSGAQEISMPFLRLLDGAGNEIPEVGEIEANPRWLGMIRRLQPSITEDGAIYFDVPVGAYKLEVIDPTDAENEHAALIEIPASLAPPAAGPVEREQ
jgi:hypothetical protein